MAELVQVTLDDEGAVEFTCRVCGQVCAAPPDVPVARATQEFLEMHPATPDPDAHDEGCPEAASA